MIEARGGNAPFLFMRAFLFFVLSLASFSALSSEYYWVDDAFPSVHYQSAYDACQAKVNRETPGRTFTVQITGEGTNGVGAYCHTYWNGSFYGTLAVSREGNSCPAGSTYNLVTGGCDTPSQDAGKQCGDADSSGLVKITNSSGHCVAMLDADQASQCKYLGNQGPKAIDFFVAFTQDGNPVNPPSPEKFGCEVKIMSVANCKLPAAKSIRGVSLAPAQVARCKVSAYFTGEVSGTGKMTAGSPATGAEGQCGDAVDCTPPDEPKVQEQKPCNYVLDGEGRKVCSSSNFTGDPGSMDCGSVNGSFTCITKPAKSTGQMTDTKVDTKANADGSTTTTKTDTITQITCGGAGSCVSTTTKVSQVTTKDGNGNTTGNSTSCTGAKCASSTNPDADGDGLGDCVKDCDKGSPSVGSLTKPASGSFDGMGDEWDQKIADAKGELMDKLDQLKSAFNPIGNVSLSSGGNLYCADAPEVLGKKFDACVSVYDEQLSWIALAILVTCACIALCIVFI
ncbi:TPA: hypothetical protein MNK97_005283 [Klebsiella pneumoniae]|nr:hypothetical protein [Klebsiella pneumoniae]